MPSTSSRAARSAATAIALTAAAGAVSAAHSADRLVPQQYATIQAAINASTNGDRVLVSPGLYRESVRFLGKSVMVEGVPGQTPEQVVITGRGVAGPAVQIADSTSYVGQVGLRNLTIDGEGVVESGQFAGVSISYLGPSARALVEHCVLRDNRSGVDSGGALWIGHPMTTVQYCAFSRNSSTVHGAAIYAYDGVDALVQHCSFDSHTTGTGTFYSRINARINVRDCVIRNSNVLTAHFQNGVVILADNGGCQIGSLSNGGFVDGGGNQFTSGCRDCDGDGTLDIEEAIRRMGGCADCNGDGRADFIQCRTGLLADFDGNAIPDCCEAGAPCTVGPYPIQWRAQEGGNGHWYQLRPKVGDWLACRAEAESMGGDLATPATAMENAFIEPLVPSPQFPVWNRAFIGGRQVPGADPLKGWYWVDGSPWQFTDWETNQPNGGEGFLAMYRGQSACNWGDYGINSGEINFYLIEWSADCNGDALVDKGQILRGELADIDQNGVPDLCQCPGDVTLNHVVDGVDLAALLGAWGTSGQGQFRTDIDSDGIVGGTDLAFVLSGWGPCPG